MSYGCNCSIQSITNRFRSLDPTTKQMPIHWNSRTKNFYLSFIKKRSRMSGCISRYMVLGFNLWAVEGFPNWIASYDGIGGDVGLQTYGGHYVKVWCIFLSNVVSTLFNSLRNPNNCIDLIVCVILSRIPFLCPIWSLLSRLWYNRTRYPFP